MGIDDRLDSYYQERTLDIIKRKTFMAKIGDTKEPAGWHTKAKQAIYKDLIELSICVGMTQVSEGKWKKDLAVPADKLKEYCGIE